MVVIRDTREFLQRTFGDQFLSRLERFSRVIGFSLDSDDDYVKVEFNPDRPDLFSFYSLSKSMDIFYGKEEPAGLALKHNEISVHITSDALSIRPFFLCFVAEGPELGERLQRIIEYQERLHDTLGRERKNISAGIHSLEESQRELTYSLELTTKIRMKTFDGELEGTALDILQNHLTGKKYSSLLPSMDRINAIKDSSGEVLSIPPIANSYRSRITERSSRMFIDVEGMQELSAIQALLLLAYEFRSMGYAISIPSITGISTETLSRLRGENLRTISVRRSEIKRVLGYDLNDGEIESSLKRMGFTFQETGDEYHVKVPGNRIDVMGAVDIIEDIAKGVGYDSIPYGVIPPQTLGVRDHGDGFLDTIREVLTGSGYQEVKSYVIGSQLPYGILKYEGGVRIFNPKSSDFSMVRDRLFPGMMEIIKQNRNRPLPQKIFEVGDVVSNGTQKAHVCIMLHDSRATFSSAKQILEYFTSRFSEKKIKIEHGHRDGLVDGRTGTIFMSGTEIGYIGEMHPELLDLYRVETPVSLAELDLSVFKNIIEAV
ncbi:MAG: phenylalanine--tRNA ligase subunit beta [Thermoplasmataceae archaeon]